MSAAVSVRVPASTANLGPGFDCLGLALGLYHELTVETGDGRAGGEVGLRLTVAGEGAAALARSLAHGEDNAVLRGLRGALAEAGYDGPDLEVHSRSQIPLARGLGSSAAAFVAGRAAGEQLARGGVDRERLLALGLAWEGHADNVVPCVMGGFTVVCRSAAGGGLDWARIDPPKDLAAVVAVPDFELPTVRSRAALPASVSRDDAVHGLAHSALLTAAMASGRLDLLARAMEDRIHEPYRAALVPGMQPVRQAALEAGALGTALSGAGPSILALVRGHETCVAVGQAMVAAWRRADVEARSLPLAVDGEGLRVEVHGHRTRSGKR